MITNFSLNLLQQTFVFDVRCVGLRCRAEALHATSYLFGSLKQYLADYKVVSKWKWLFVISCEFKSPVLSVTEFWNVCQDGEYVPVALWIITKNNGTSVE